MENMGTANADTSASVVTQIASSDLEIETVVDVASIEAQNLSTEVPVGTDISHDELVRDISVRIRNLRPPPSKEICIYRVPENIRKLDEDAYTPQVVSIGPYHHGNTNFASMEDEKWRYFEAFSQRSGVSRNRYVELMKKNEARARACYADTIEMSSDEFVTMMMVDGCFILELLGCYNDESNIFPRNWPITRIFHDLILLENQIPLFILESIYHLAFPPSDSTYRLHESIHQFFKSENNQNKSLDDIQFGKVKHFTDFIRKLCLPRKEPSFGSGNCFGRIRRHSRNGPLYRDSDIKLEYTATQLRQAGVKFKADSSKCLLDVKFKGGVLKFPRLTLTDRTVYIFRNLMALEVCHYSHHATPIIDYVFFVDSLIDTPNDVDLLVKKRMLYNGFGSSGAAADIINKLCREVTHCSNNSYLIPLICVDLNAYYNLPKNRCWAALKLYYCNTPWRTAATIGAILLLLLASIQTVSSLISVFNGK